MQIRKAGGIPNHKPLKSFTFINTITRFRNMVVKEDLESAYIRAGRAVNGNLRQNFVVLHEGQTFQKCGNKLFNGPNWIRERWGLLRREGGQGVQVLAGVMG